MVDYMISGLDAMTVELVLAGSSHFMNNLNPSFYAISDITLIDGEANISFVPTDNLPEQLHMPVNYSIMIQPHEAFSLVVKDTTKKKTKYVFLNCRLDEEGKPFFHFDVLSKTNKGPVDERIHRGVSVAELLIAGYVLEKSYDDKKSTIAAVTLYGHKKAS